MQSPMGARLDGTTCHFRIWAPHAARVFVMGSFNDWRDAEHLLAPDAEGIWSVSVPNVHAGDEYLYVIDNRGEDDPNPGQLGLRRVDPWARAIRHSSGNGVILDVAAELASSGLLSDPFETPSTNDWLIYQAHVGSFVGLGDGIDTDANETGSFPQFEQKLAYIRALGFNALALLPIHENPGDGHEGYAPAHLFAPESSFGSPLQLRHLIRAAHDVGLAVIFDVVWNHMSDVDNRLWEFDGMTRDGGIYFEGGERSPWGPRPAFWKREVRDLIVGNARMYFEEYHIDGLRIDAADEMGFDVLHEVVAAVREEPRWQDKLLIAEWTGNDALAWPELIERLHFDRIWALEDPLLFRGAAGLDPIDDPAFRVACLERLLELPGASKRIRYLLGSHDSAHDNTAGNQPSARYFVELAGGRDTAVARAKSRMGWLLSVLLPGTPMCFMGTEWHQPGYWHPRRDGNQIHDDHRVDWALCGDQHGTEMRALVGDANEMRWQEPALRHDTIGVHHVDHDNGIVAFLRPDPDGRPILVVINASDNSWSPADYNISAPDGASHWSLLFDSQEEQYGGESRGGTMVDSTVDGELSFGLPRWSVTAWKAER